ncbi:MAG TPA: RsmE family RNA methyltransferase, partial [Bryobacteraceae bacterium]
RLPKISPATQFEDALAWNARHRYWLDEEPGGQPLLTSIPASRNVDDSVALLIGPEGGWTADERASALAQSAWSRTSMGPQILRAETAAVASLAVVMAAWQAPAVALD